MTNSKSMKVILVILRFPRNFLTLEYAALKKETLFCYRLYVAVIIKGLKVVMETFVYFTVMQYFHFIWRVTFEILMGKITCGLWKTCLCKQNKMYLILFTFCIK